MNLEANVRKLTQEEAAILAVVSQGGLMELRQIVMAMGESEKGWRAVYRRMRRLRALPSDRLSVSEKRVRQMGRMRDDFRCPVCGKARVSRVSRTFNPQWGSAEFRYQHSAPGSDGDGVECTLPRLSIAEAKRLKRSEDQYAVAPPEKELLDAEGTRVAGSPKLVFGMNDDGAASLAAWCQENGTSFPIRSSPDAEGWRFLEHALLTSEVYVRTLVAAGCARRPWALQVSWDVEPGALKWSPIVRTPDGRLEVGSFRYVKPDITILVPPRNAPGLERGRRVFVEVERGTQALTDPNSENAGAVESKVKRYESFCCYGRQAEARSYYRTSFPDDAAEPWVVVVSSEKRRKAIKGALGDRESLSERGFHGFRVRLTTFEEVGKVLAELAGVNAQPVAAPGEMKAPWRRKGPAAPEPPEVRLNLDEVAVLGAGVLKLRQLYERLRERVRTSNEALPEARRIAIEDTPAAWSSGARPIVERLLQEVFDAKVKQKAVAKAEKVSTQGAGTDWPVSCPE